MKKFSEKVFKDNFVKDFKRDDFVVFDQESFDGLVNLAYEHGYSWGKHRANFKEASKKEGGMIVRLCHINKHITWYDEYVFMFKGLGDLHEHKYVVIKEKAEKDEMLYQNFKHIKDIESFKRFFKKNTFFESEADKEYNCENTAIVFDSKEDFELFRVLVTHRVNSAECNFGKNDGSGFSKDKDYWQVYTENHQERHGNKAVKEGRLVWVVNWVTRQFYFLNENSNYIQKWGEQVEKFSGKKVEFLSFNDVKENYKKAY